MKIHEIEQNTPEWLLLRAGKPTASEFKKLVSGTGQLSKSMSAYARKLAAEVYAGKPLEQWEGNQWTERGHDMEILGADEYELTRNCSISQVGFVTDDLEKYGCSPDRLVDNDGLLEIKSLSASNHIEALLYIDKNKDIPPDYRTQVQGQILVCERDWCDVLFFHPDLPSKTLRILPDAEFVEKLTGQINAVLKERDNIVLFLNKEA